MAQNVVVSMPAQLFTMARSFRAVANGKIFVGVVDADPTLTQNQVPVYVENEDGTMIQVTQPLTVNAAGYPSYNGQIAKFLVDGAYSMTVLDNMGVLQFYFPNILKYDPDQYWQLLKGSGGAEMVGYGENTVDYELRIHGATTSSYGIGFTDPAEWNNTTDHQAALQEMFNKERHVIFDTYCNTADVLVSAFEGQKFSAVRGKGRLTPIMKTNGLMDRRAMILFKHEHCQARGMVFDNPDLLKSTATGSNFGRQGSIDMQADYCSIRESLFLNQLNAVVASSQYSPTGLQVIGNDFLDCIGVALEDRGDAVTLWASGSIIADNYATCKSGEDARVAFHFEAPVSTPTNPRPALDAQHNVMIGNRALGNFRRHFAFEGISNFSSIGNVSMGGATWWGEVYIQCRNGIIENSILYTRTADQTQGASWNPVRSGCCLMNWSDRIAIKSTIRMAADSVGTAFAIGTRTTSGFHRVNYDAAQAVNLGVATNNFMTLVPAMSATDEVNLDGVKAIGFARQLAFAPASGAKLRVKNCVLDANGTLNSTGIIQLTGSGGDLVIEGSEINAPAAFGGINLGTMDDVIIRGNKISGNDYAITIGAVTERMIIEDNGSFDASADRKGIRYGSVVSGVLSSDIIWSIENNTGMYADRYPALSLAQSATSKLNTQNKWRGKWIQMNTDNSFRMYYATGGGAAAAWRNSDNGQDITPS